MKKGDFQFRKTICSSNKKGIIKVFENKAKLTLKDSVTQSYELFINPSGIFKINHYLYILRCRRGKAVFR